jgi:hypothetical protein
MRFFNDRLLNAGKSSSVVFAALEQISADGNFRGVMEDHGRNVGKAHGLKSTVVSLSKVVISQLLAGDENTLAPIKDEMLSAYGELCGIPIPGSVREELISDAEQELSEAIFCEAFAGFIFVGAPIKSLTADAADISIRGWLAGLTDAVSEMSKLMGDFLSMRELTEEEELAVLGRYLEFAKNACSFLSTFKGVPPTALNASRRPGQGFQSKLVRVEELVRKHEREYLQLRREVRRANSVVGGAK